jgi:hypothetical protein
MDADVKGIAFVLQTNMSAFFRRYALPLLLFAVTALAYGWQVNRLGFYWDDWVFVYRYQTLGVFNTIFYGGTRQLGVFALLPGFLFAGDTPLFWHLYSLFLRWGVTLLFWWAFNQLWPGQKTAVTLMAALFAVHPAFSQQSISVVYSLQFVTYAIFLFSFGSMLRGEQAGKWRWLWFALALAGQALHLFIVEYFVGLELIRPVALYCLQNGGSRWQRVKTALLRWLPYLLVLFLYAVWRSGVLGGGFDTYEYKTFLAFLRIDPRAALIEAVEYGLKDLLVLLVNTWQGTLSPAVIDLGQPFNLFSLLVAALSAFGLAFVLSRLNLDGDTPESDHFLKQAALLALTAVVVGFIPAWFVRRHIVEPGNFGDRFALAGLLGASLALVALTQFFGGRRGRGILLASLFIGLAIGAQIRYANNYRWDWDRQLSTYWQLAWRAPGLQPGTVLVGYDSISATTVNYVGAFALNNLYQSNPPPASPKIWYVNYPKTTIAANLDPFLSGAWTFKDEFDTYLIPVTPQNSLGINYTSGGCLKVLTTGDVESEDLPVDFRPVAGFSNPALILSESGQTPPRRIFGSAPETTWCYFYEKADLARQFGQWEQVTALKKQADSLGLEPLTVSEWSPFIEAEARLGNWTAAQKLTSQAYASSHKSWYSLCQLWQRLEPAAPEGYDAAFQNINAQFGCQ